MEILENAVLAVEALCPKLRFWTLQTGGKVEPLNHPFRYDLFIPTVSRDIEFDF